jgi:hypothetical protein
VSGPLPDYVRAALEKPELEAFWRQIRKQLERNGAEPRGVVRVPVSDHVTASELGALLGRRRMAPVGSKVAVELSDLDSTFRAGAAQRGLAEVVVALTGEPLLQRQTERERRTAENEQILRELLDLLADVPELDHERMLLAAVPVDSVLRVPAESAARSGSWQVYEAALRAAAIWWEAHRAGRRMAEKELAGKAFRDTKAWTDAKRIAFAYLVKQPFDRAVDEADVAIKISGPLVWKTDETIADAGASAPWIAVPARGIRALGEVECGAVGIFVVENTEAFEKVCVTEGIAERWLCVWLQGNPSGRLIAFLRSLDLPVAAWCDLDAYGVRMVAYLEKNLERTITPVGMSVDLWRAGTKRLQTESQLEKARGVAAQFVEQGPVSVRSLAAEIAKTGDCCEHETLYPEVLPSLDATLRKIEHGQVGLI